MIEPANVSADVSNQLEALLERAVALESAIAAGAASDDPSVDHQQGLQFVADRLTRSVIRPITQALDGADGSHATPHDAEPAHDDTQRGQGSATGGVEGASAADEQLLGLAQAATRLRVLSGVPALQEAVAALQDLVNRSGLDAGEDATVHLLAEFRKSMGVAAAPIRPRGPGQTSPFVAQRAPVRGCRFV